MSEGQPTLDGASVGSLATPGPSASGPVPLGRKLSWALGSVADQFLTNGLGALALPIYSISLGVSPVLVGYALAIPRFFDAVTDPIMGNISDNTRTRWGRRRPYILVGAVACAILFVLLWTPPRSLDSSGLFFYFLVVSLVYFAAYTVLSVPRSALGLELCTDYHERTTLFAYNAVLASTAGFAIPWLYKLSFDPWFAGPTRDEVVGVRGVAVLAGIVILVTAAPSALFVRENAAAQRQPSVGFIRACRLTVSNGSFLLITGVVVLILLAVTLAGPINLYLNIYFICDGDKELGAFWGGWAGATQALMGLGMAPVVALMARHLGKKRTIVFGLCLATAGYLATWWLFNPRYPWLQVLFMAMLQPGLMTVWVLNGSILADICDDDELRTGLRREGMFGAAYTLITKAVSASVTMVAGYLLVWAGYREGEAITPETITNLRVLFIVIPVIMLIVALALALRFPITEETARRTRALLEARKAEA